jgi:biotin transporter BioY
MALTPEQRQHRDYLIRRADIGLLKCASIGGALVGYSRHRFEKEGSNPDDSLALALFLGGLVIVLGGTVYFGLRRLGAYSGRSSREQLTFMLNRQLRYIFLPCFILTLIIIAIAAATGNLNAQ